MPLFLTQLTGASHDNIFKNAIVVLLIFGVSNLNPEGAKLLTIIATTIFILPYILFSALGGELSDKFDKSKLIQYLKIAELFIVIIGCYAIFLESIPLALLTLFALGTHSALFAPSKYSILPQQLATEDLISANAILNSGTFLAILLGTIVGAGIINVPFIGKGLICGLLFACAFIGWLASRSIPSCTFDSTKKISPNIFKSTKDSIKIICSLPKRQFLTVLGNAWFFFIGSMFLAQLPNYVKDALCANEQVLIFLLVIFSIGIAIGGLMNNKLLKGRIEATYVPLAALGLTIFCFDIYFASNTSMPASATRYNFFEFINHVTNWRIALDILMIAAFGGLFVVPLNTLIQHRTSEELRAKVIGGCAIIDALFIVTSSIFSAILISFGCAIKELFLVFGIANGLIALYICYLLPDYVLKSILRIIFKVLYKVEVNGIENLSKAGPRAVIIANHVSFLDAPLMTAFLPGKPIFAIDTEVASWVWLKPFLKIVDTFAVNPTNPFAIKSLIRKVQEDQHLVIFPEGRLTQTGALMKIYEGAGMVAKKSQAMIVPVRIDGVQHTNFSRLKGKIFSRAFPKITINILEPKCFQKVASELRGPQARKEVGSKLYDLMEQMLFTTSNREQTLFNALIKISQPNRNTVILEDIDRKPMKYKKLLQSCMVLGRKLAQQTTLRENVGILLPNSLACVISFFALQADGRTPTMLNFSLGTNAICSACNSAQVKNIITSRKFVLLARLDKLIAELSKDTTFVYLEDIRKQITWKDKLFGLFANPFTIHNQFEISAHEPAVVLFTSGSEGSPKGVVLSHFNIMSNIRQMESRVDFNQQDIIFNCLPLFHSFGLTSGMLLPVLCGIQSFLYPSPLHYRIIPEVIYSINATIMFGTDTFLTSYAKVANPYDFYRMRYIFAGAEKLKDETRKIYMEKFGCRIFEGYGATETAPVLSLNSAQYNQPGSVGKFLPCIEHTLEDVPGITEGGRLHVRGPNIMLGYYKADMPGVIQQLPGGWYDTGDIVNLDSNGFIKILGRAKRFAKIAGEMVSLSFVEELVQKVCPASQHAVIALADARKGERLCLITTANDLSRETLTSYAASNGISSLNIPNQIETIKEIPILPTGKINYVELQKIYC